jgi:hypothetical protein
MTLKDMLRSAVAACGDLTGSTPYWDALRRFNFGDAFVCPFWDTVGQLATGLLVWGAISTAIYIVNGSIIIPYILLLLLGGVVLTQVASVGVTLAGVIILGVLGAVPTYFVWRYSP